MILKFVGTGSGKTSVSRFHSSIIFDNGEGLSLVDAGDGISRGLLTRKIEFNDINSILLSHYHADHFAGIASLVTQMKLNNRKRDLRIYTHENLISPLRNYLNYCYLFEEKLGFELKIMGYAFNKEMELERSLRVLPKRNSHISFSDGYSNTSGIQFFSSSFMFKWEERVVLYTSDIGSSSDLYLFSDNKIDYLITEASHISTDDIFDAVLKLAPVKAVITHVEEEKERDLSAWAAKHQNLSATELLIAFDGMSLDL